MPTIEHWINGTNTPAGSTRTAPAASKAFETSGDSSLSHRTKVVFAFRELLVKHEDELGRIISREHGKLVDDARGEIVRGREIVESRVRRDALREDCTMDKSSCTQTN